MVCTSALSWLMIATIPGKARSTIAVSRSSPASPAICQHRLEQILNPRRLEDADRLVRPLVEHRVAHHDAQLGLERGAQTLEDRVKIAAGLAGGVKEFDQRDRCIRRAEDRRIGPDQGGVGIAGIFGVNIGGGLRGGTVGGVAARHEHGAPGKNHQPKGGGTKKKAAAVHGLGPFDMTRLALIAANAVSER